jgi:GGDEF domain-containing protein
MMWWRAGGDEFTLLLPDTTTESAYAVAENVLARIMATPVVPNDGLTACRLALALLRCFSMPKRPRHC